MCDDADDVLARARIDCIDVDLPAMLARKRDLAAALLDGGGNALTGLTLADVDELLSPLAAPDARPS